MKNFKRTELIARQIKKYANDTPETKYADFANQNVMPVGTRKNTANKDCRSCVERRHFSPIIYIMFSGIVLKGIFDLSAVILSEEYV